MPWAPEDWEAQLLPDDNQRSGIPESTQVVREVLRKLPHREAMKAVQLRRAAGSQAPLFPRAFGDVVTIDPQRHGVRHAWLDALPRRADVVVALDVLLGRAAGETMRALGAVHGCLVEGGVLLATFPADSRRCAERQLGMGPDAVHGGAIHEMELQYRLRCTGFQGLRIRRFEGPTLGEDAGRESAGPRAVGDDVLLAMAVRRSNN